MKKPVCILMICFLSGMVSAQTTKGGKVSPTLDNPSIRKSERAENRQLKSFQNHKRYSAVVNNPAAKAAKRSQKAGKGKEKGL